MKKLTISLLTLTVALALLAGSCRNDDGNLNDGESIVYVTGHDTTNFANYQTFRVGDSVSVIKDGQLINHTYNTYDSTLRSAISQSMIQRGYQLLTDSLQTPDIGINVSRFVADFTGEFSHGNYRDGYGSYRDPYYWGFGGYGYYFPYSLGTYSFREGAISIDMFDLKNPNQVTAKLNVIWSGLAYGTGIFNTGNISTEVQTLFKQSPYIHH